MNRFNYDYQSEFARRYFAEGKAEGRVEGRTEGRVISRRIILRVLRHRFGTIDEASRRRLEDASLLELDAIGERLMTSPSLEDALSYD